MAKILIVEDDSTVGEMERQCLQAAGHEVTMACDGAIGLHMALDQAPDLIVSDVRMPGLNGFQLLSALRSNDLTADTPVIFVATAQSRELMRQGMDAGADDFLIKPVVAFELVAAVNARLARVHALREAFVRRQSRPTAVDAPRSSDTARVRSSISPMLPSIPTMTVPLLAAIESPELARAAPDAPIDAAALREVRSGTLVHITVRNTLAMARGFTAAQRRNVLQDFFARLCEPLLAQFGWVVRHSAREITVVFDALPSDVETTGPTQDHAARALRGALLAVLSAHQFRLELQHRTSGRRMYEFSVGIAIDSGKLEIVTSTVDGTQETTVTGRIAQSLAQVDAVLIDVGWSIAASELTLRAANGGFATGRDAELVLGTSRQPTSFVEVIGFGQNSHDTSGFAPVYAAVSDAIRANSALAEVARVDGDGAASDARGTRTGPHLITNGAGRTVSGAQAIVIPGYRIVRKLGAGGMSRVYLARHEESGREEVLKILPTSDDEELLQRFIQEYALIAQVRHPNVAHIYSQGFEAGCAYIAMEYMAGGDLRDRIASGISYRDSIRYLMHTTQALAAIHDCGIVHRDLKPENLMLRGDGVLVLADFGIAKQASTALTRTRHGEVYGTPYYMSPEQAGGLAIDGRSDQYSLGVIFHEMLTGAKPFTAARAEALVYQHLHSDTPILPGRFWRVQPMLDRLLAKHPRERYESASVLLLAVREAMTDLEHDHSDSAAYRTASLAMTE